MLLLNGKHTNKSGKSSPAKVANKKLETYIKSTQKYQNKYQHHPEKGESIVTFNAIQYDIVLYRLYSAMQPK